MYVQSLLLLGADDTRQLCSVNIWRTRQITRTASTFDQIKQYPVIVGCTACNNLGVAVHANKLCTLMVPSRCHKVPMVFSSPSSWAGHRCWDIQNSSIDNLTNSARNIVFAFGCKWRGRRGSLIFSCDHGCSWGLRSCFIFIILWSLWQTQIIRAAPSVRVKLSSSYAYQIIMIKTTLC